MPTHIAPLHPKMALIPGVGAGNSDVNVRRCEHTRKETVHWASGERGFVQVAHISPCHTGATATGCPSHHLHSNDGHACAEAAPRLPGCQQACRGAACLPQRHGHGVAPGHRHGRSAPPPAHPQRTQLGGLAAPREARSMQQLPLPRSGPPPPG